MVLGLGSILPSFKLLGMVFCWMDRLKMSNRALMTTGPSCSRCLCVIPSEPTEEVAFCPFNCLFRHVGGLCSRWILSIFMLVGSCDSLVMVA